MKGEALLFAGVALFFAVTAGVYAWFSLEPAGTAALTVSCLMSALVAFFCWIQYARHGSRAQDRKGAAVGETTGHLDFFPPRSYAPVVTALAFAVLATGVVYGLWLFLIGFGLLAPGVAGFTFQYKDRGT
ncbi:cytochrome c oxidase subunit 4 [Streptomyces armeniacus]|uniref:cytochrome-c oxidase n=1 Tax=Streptomyces armeniacus TaxID=83291 RepID=A0A345XQT3_9ACTN|nr:cytochrome c oxidase subunit 4 [Streptomyces armeniacus]AXK33999.1 cytochrome c oxidase subunit 4 [Streptomyces armeniacus]